MATTASAPPAPPPPAATPVQGGTKFEYWKLANEAALPPPYKWKQQPAAPIATAPAAAAATPLNGAAATAPTIPPVAGPATGVTAAAMAAPGGAIGATGGTAPATDETPKEYIKKYYETTDVAPFGKNGQLKPQYLVTKLDVVRAALSAGYGNRLHLTGTSHAATTVGMRRYLSHRLEMLLACLDYSSPEVIPKSFYEHVEATEKGALAFIAGCLGTHIAARVWMAGAGTRTKRFLHTGIYTKATTVLPSALAKVGKNKQKGKIPDFLVQDGNSDWHVFESKGGNVSSRWPQLIAGLEQLVNVSTVGTVSQPPAAPTTTVCVQTVLEHNKPLSIVLVDPPAEGKGEADGVEPTPAVALTFVPGVAEMLAAVEALDWYHGLKESDLAMPNAESQNNLWELARSTAFGGIFLGVPSRLLSLEDDLRADLGRYLALQQALEVVTVSEKSDETSPRVAVLPGDRRAFNIRLGLLLRAQADARPIKGSMEPPADDVYAQIEQAANRGSSSTYGVFHAWSLQLDLARWVHELDEINEDAKRSLGLQDGWDLPGGEVQVTESGLYLRLA